MTKIEDTRPAQSEQPAPVGRLAQGDAAAWFDALTRRAVTRPEENHLLPVLLCQAAVQVLPIDGAAISVRLGCDVSVPIGASDPQAAAAEQLEFSLAQGPCLQATLSGRRVLVPDLDQPQPSTAWPTYVAEAIRRTPFRAVFSFPLPLIGFTLGTVDLYRCSAGDPWGEDELTVVERIASRIAGELRAADLFHPDDDHNHHEWMSAPAIRRRDQVSIAQGMTMQASTMSAREALALLRAHTYAADRLLEDVAEDIISHRLAPPDLRS